MYNKLVIAGGTGFLGRVLIHYYQKKFREIVVLSRQTAKQKGNVAYLNWDAKTLGAWSNFLEDADLLINLVGKSVDCRYHSKNKAEILSSRINSTKVLCTAVNACASPPKHFIQSSTATIYIHALDQVMDEENGVIGDDFSMNVAKKWEECSAQNLKVNIRRTVIRTSIVLGKNGGALQPLLKIAKLGLGGKQGSGKQKVSWIQELDFARAIDYCYQNNLQGKINVTAPNRPDNKTFMQEICKVLNIKIALPAQEWMLAIGTFLLQTEAELILKSRNVHPQKLLNCGFEFKYPSLEAALQEIVLN